MDKSKVSTMKGPESFHLMTGSLRSCIWVILRATLKASLFSCCRITQRKEEVGHEERRGDLVKKQGQGA